MPLAKIKHEITEGNDSGFAIIDTDTLLQEHEVIEIFGDDIIDYFIAQSYKLKALFEILTDVQKAEIERRLNPASTFAEKVTEAVKPAKATKVAEQPPAPAGEPSPHPQSTDPNVGWAKPLETQ